MTRVSYLLSNGIETTSHREALASGLEFTVLHTKIAEPPAHMSEKRKANRPVAKLKPVSL